MDSKKEMEKLACPVSVTCIEITGNNWNCICILKNVKSCKENSKGFKSYKEFKF